MSHRRTLATTTMKKKNSTRRGADEASFGWFQARLHRNADAAAATARLRLHQRGVAGSVSKEKLSKRMLRRYVGVSVCVLAGSSLLAGSPRALSWSPGLLMSRQEKMRRRCKEEFRSGGIEHRLDLQDMPTRARVTRLRCAIFIVASWRAVCPPPVIPKEGGLDAREVASERKEGDDDGAASRRTEEKTVGGRTTTSPLRYAILAQNKSRSRGLPCPKLKRLPRERITTA
jgi:hypothetical protein